MKPNNYLICQIYNTYSDILPQSESTTFAHYKENHSQAGLLCAPTHTGYIQTSGLPPALEFHSEALNALHRGGRSTGPETLHIPSRNPTGVQHSKRWHVRMMTLLRPRALPGNGSSALHPPALYGGGSSWCSWPGSAAAAAAAAAAAGHHHHHSYCRPLLFRTSLVSPGQAQSRPV